MVVGLSAVQLIAKVGKLAGNAVVNNATETLAVGKKLVTNPSIPVAVGAFRKGSFGVGFAATNIILDELGRRIAHELDQSWLSKAAAMRAF